MEIEEIVNAVKNQIKLALADQFMTNVAILTVLTGLNR